MKSANFVAYALAADGGSRAVLCSPRCDDPAASLQIAHATSKAYSDAEKRGVPLPEIVVVREERAEGEGVEKSARFWRVHPTTLDRKKDDAGASDLSEILKKGAQ